MFINQHRIVLIDLLDTSGNTSKVRTVYAVSHIIFNTSYHPKYLQFVRWSIYFYISVCRCAFSKSEYIFVSQRLTLSTPLIFLFRKGSLVCKASTTQTLQHVVSALRLCFSITTNHRETTEIMCLGFSWLVKQSNLLFANHFN